MPILTLRPNGAGDYTALGLVPNTGEANWQDVDEAVADDLTTYVFKAQGVAAAKDAYALENTAQSGIINSVKVYFRCQSGSVSVVGWAQPFLRLSGVETAGTEVAVTPPNTWINYNETLGKPGGGSWSWANINDLQVCIGLRWPDGELGRERCTQVYVEVDYTEAAGLENKSANMGAKLMAAGAI